LPTQSNHCLQRGLLAAAPAALFACCCIAAGAQQRVNPPQTGAARNPASLAQAVLLPNAPSANDSSNAASSSAGGVIGSPVPSEPEVPRTQKVIQPGESAPALDARDKALLGVKNSFSAFAASGWVAAAGYEQLVNGSPNFGTDRGAFGERLGAAVLRDSSEGILSDSAMAPLFREDPRYYRLGPTRKLRVRVLYAITRPLITRTDAGALSPNFALWSGTLGGAALTNAYYPRIDRGPAHTLEIFGGSIGGEAISDLFREFFCDFTGLLHSQHE
jgi:hypothetical protein